MSAQDGLKFLSFAKETTETRFKHTCMVTIFEEVIFLFVHGRFMYAKLIRL